MPIVGHFYFENQLSLLVLFLLLMSDWGFFFLIVLYMNEGHVHINTSVRDKSKFTTIVEELILLDSEDVCC